MYSPSGPRSATDEMYIQTTAPVLDVVPALVAAGHAASARRTLSPEKRDVVGADEVGVRPADHLDGLVPEHRRHLGIDERRAELAVAGPDALIGDLDHALVLRLARAASSSASTRAVTSRP